MSGTAESGRKSSGVVRNYEMMKVQRNTPMLPLDVTPPDWLANKAGRKYWDKLIPILAEIKSLSDLDKELFARYCHFCAGFVELSNKPFDDYNISSLSRLNAELLKMEKELGFSPMQRAKMQFAALRNSNEARVPSPEKMADRFRYHRPVIV